MRVVLLLVSLIISFVACSSKTNSTEPSLINKTDSLIAFKRNAILGRGMNFGNALEAPHEGEWGLMIKESYIQEVKDAGFNSVLPGAGKTKQYLFKYEGEQLIPVRVVIAEDVFAGSKEGMDLLVIGA